MLSELIPKLNEEPSLNPVGISLHKSCIQAELTSCGLDVG